MTRDNSYIPTDRPIVVQHFFPNSKKPFITMFRVNMFSILLLLPLIYLHSVAQPYYVLSLIVNIAIFLSAFTFIVTRIIAFVSTEPLNGQLKGKIIFNKKGIELNKKLYDFSEIQDISIDLNQYYKERGSGITATPVFSNGIDNKLTFRLAGLYTYSYFQVGSKKQMLDIITYLKSLDSSIKINVTYKDTRIKVQAFDPKLYGLL